MQSQSTGVRSFGVAGALDHGIVGPLAEAVESSGYASFWANDTEQGDGLASLAVAAGRTSRIGLAVGVIPVDRVPATEIARRIADYGLPVERLTIGLGSGMVQRGALDVVRREAEALRQLSGVRVLVGALGPNMVALGGAAADGVLLNWLVPAWAARSADDVRASAELANRPNPHVAGYIRAALGEESRARLEAEALRYEGYPSYGAHFGRMGVRAINTCVLGHDGHGIQAGLTPFADVLDETVVRAIVAEESLDDYLALAHAAMPSTR